MASFTRRRGGQVTVWVRKDGKNVPLPRSKTKHLDYEPDHNVRAWIAQWEEQNGIRPVSDAKLNELLERFIIYCRDDLKRDLQTYTEHQRHLEQHVLPYFLTLDPPRTDPNSWPSCSVQMRDALRKEGLTEGQIYRCNIALRQFFKWLAEEKEVLGDGTLLLRKPDMSEYGGETPLKVFLNPPDVLDLIAKAPHPDWALTLVLGYFFSLRPEEIFGARVGDLRVGAAVRTLEASKAMRKLGLYDGLAFNVTRQMNKRGKEGNPKDDSFGWVCCFDKTAAATLVQSLGNKQPDERILERMPYKFYKDWPFDEFEPKDLRRASLYWLGHNTDMSQNQMMKHARQKTEEALRLYLRRPTEALDEWTGLKVSDL